MPAKRVILDIDPTSDLETSWVKRGSNPMSKVFLKKSADEPQLEKTNMALKSVLLASIAASALGKSYLFSLAKEEDVDAFVAKSSAERAADLTAFAKAKNMEVDCDGDGPVAKAAKKPVEPDEDDMKKAAPVLKAEDISALIAKGIEESPVVKSLREENATLKGNLDKVSKGAIETSLRKRAETEFAGIGKSTDEMVSVLKALDGLEDAAVRKHVEDIFKAHTELAARVAKARGVFSVVREGSATAELDKMAEDIAKAEKITKEAAIRKISEDPAHAELIERADQEALDAQRAA